METIVQQSLGHVQRGYAGALVGQAVEHELMLAVSLDGKFVQVLQAFLDIIGVQHGHRAHFLDLVAAEAQNIGVCLHHDAEVAEECGHTSQ